MWYRVAQEQYKDVQKCGIGLLRSSTKSFSCKQYTSPLEKEIRPTFKSDSEPYHYQKLIKNVPRPVGELSPRTFSFGLPLPFLLSD